MARIYARSGKLYFDYFTDGKRVRKASGLVDSAKNRKLLDAYLKKMAADKECATLAASLSALGAGEQHEAAVRAKLQSQTKEFAQGMGDGIGSPAPTLLGAPVAPARNLPQFGQFSEQWYEEKKVEWRTTQKIDARGKLDGHLLPFFGGMRVDAITKTDILEFRGVLAEKPGREGEKISKGRINHIMGTLKMIVDEAAERFGYPSQYRNIKRLKTKKPDVDPFTLKEVKMIISAIRPDFKDYMIVRFFTGMRTGEIDGLTWDAVDFEGRLIHVYQARVRGEMVPPKTMESNRYIQMSPPVCEALARQWKATGSEGGFVFCSPNGHPMHHGNFCKRVWDPLLRYLDVRRRTPYQTRHTAATLWMGAGENPEWIARQMGHSTTEMLFRVYSRYVPNLTRRDGSAMDKLLEDALDGDPGETE